MKYDFTIWNWYISVKSKTGKMTIKKGLDKGRYKLKLKIKASGDKTYNAKTDRTAFYLVVK